MNEACEISMRQRPRERHPGEARLIGFTTYTGTVIAASEWGGRAEQKQVPQALPASHELHERLFHRTDASRFLLTLGDVGEAEGVCANHICRERSASCTCRRPSA